MPRLTQPRTPIKKRSNRFPELVGANVEWSAICRNEWELLTGILLDTRTPLERLRATLIFLRNVGFLDYRELYSLKRREVETLLRKAGYPWAKQKSYYFHQEIDFDLKTATLEQIDSVKGIGPKLANLWMRFMNPDRQDDFVVIDTHVRRFIRTETGITEVQMNRLSYEDLSTIMRHLAKLRGATVSELDNKVVTEGIMRRLRKHS